MEQVRVESPTFGLGWLSPFPCTFESDEYRESGGTRGVRFTMHGDRCEGHPTYIDDLQLWRARTNGIRLYLRHLVCRELGLDDQVEHVPEVEKEIWEKVAQYPSFDRMSSAAEELPGPGWVRVISNRHEVFHFKKLSPADR